MENIRLFNKIELSYRNSTLEPNSFLDLFFRLAGFLIYTNHYDFDCHSKLREKMYGYLTELKNNATFIDAFSSEDIYSKYQHFMEEKAPMKDRFRIFLVDNVEDYQKGKDSEVIIISTDIAEKFHIPLKNKNVVFYQEKNVDFLLQIIEKMYENNFITRQAVEELVVLAKIYCENQLEEFLRQGEFIASINQTGEYNTYMADRYSKVCDLLNEEIVKFGAKEYEDCPFLSYSRLYVASLGNIYFDCYTEKSLINWAKSFLDNQKVLNIMRNDGIFYWIYLSIYQNKIDANYARGILMSKIKYLHEENDEFCQFMASYFEIMGSSLFDWQYQCLLRAIFLQPGSYQNWKFLFAAAHRQYSYYHKISIQSVNQIVRFALSTILSEKYKKNILTPQEIRTLFKINYYPLRREDSMIRDTFYILQNGLDLFDKIDDSIGFSLLGEDFQEKARLLLKQFLGKDVRRLYCLGATFLRKIGDLEGPKVLIKRIESIDEIQKKKIIL